MIQYSDGSLEHERHDFIDTVEWLKYLAEQNSPGATFQVKPKVWENRKIVGYPNPKVKDVSLMMMGPGPLKMDGAEDMKIMNYETVAHALNDTFAPRGVVQDLLTVQKERNRRDSDYMDAVRYGINTGGMLFIEDPRSLWQTIKGKFYAFRKWITGLRIVHKDDICDCEDY